MAGTYTQRRVIPGTGRIVMYGVDANGVRTEHYNASIPGLQTTTSYRTGLGESLVSELELSDRNTYLNNLLQTKKVTYDTGHPFSTVKKESFIRVANMIYRDSGPGYASLPWVPSEWVGPTPVKFPEIPKWVNSDSDGNKAILKTYPTAPQASLSQMIVELKNEGLPSLFGSQIASMKGSAQRAIGGEFLNSVFGWTPLIKDLEKLLKAVVESSKIIQQFERDSGRIVRRSYSFPAITELLESNIFPSVAAKAIPSSWSPFYGKSGTYTVERTRSTQIWFSGAYTYYINPGKDLVGQAIKYEQLANHLLGIRLTPDVLWNLAPWSWLADWFVNVGNNITVASAFQQDGLVLKHGYLMRKVIASDLYTFSTKSPIKGFSGTSQLVMRTTSKERVRSSPFGFGVSSDALNDRQIAILSSLGMSKGPRGTR